MSETPFKQLVLEWELGSGFLESFTDGQDEDKSLPKITAELGDDDEVESGGLYVLLLRLNERDTEFHVHGRLTGLEGRSATFELLAEERGRLEMVLVSARGESLPYRRRRHTRIPSQFSFRATDASGHEQTGETSSFGGGGAHLLMDNPIAIDEQIAVQIQVPVGRTVKLAARVTSRIDEGPQRGCSIEFLFRSAAERDEIAAVAKALLARSAKDKS